MVFGLAVENRVRLAVHEGGAWRCWHDLLSRWAATSFIEAPCSTPKCEMPARGPDPHDAGA
jgi:hypothetical protein